MKRRIGLAVALSGVLALLISAVVMGHAQLVSSDPAQGDTVTTPYTVKATFDEDLTPNGSSFVVVDASGRQVAAGALSATDVRLMTVQLPQLADGVYEARWTAVTADDLAVERGTIKFTVAANVASAAPTPVAPGTGSGANSSNTDLLIALLLAGLIVLGVLGYLFVRSRR